MPLKATDQTSGFEEIDRWDGGVGWIARPEESMQRASHALVSGEGVWVFDPVDAPEVDDLLDEFGEVAGVVVTMDRHRRDAATIADRHGVAVHVPAWMNKDVDAPVRRFQNHLADTDYRVIDVLDVPGWREAALYDEETSTLLVGEALGTAQYFLTNRERLGVHPMLRLTPPRTLGELRPRRILVGHGRGIFNDASATLQDALDGSRRRVPGILAQGIRSLF